MKGFKSPRHVQRFLTTHDQIANVFLHQQLENATGRRAARSQAFASWGDVTGVAVAA